VKRKDDAETLRAQRIRGEVEKQIEKEKEKRKREKNRAEDRPLQRRRL